MARPLPTEIRVGDVWAGKVRDHDTAVTQIKVTHVCETGAVTCPAPWGAPIGRHVHVHTMIRPGAYRRWRSIKANRFRGDGIHEIPLAKVAEFGGRNGYSLVSKGDGQ